MKAHVCIAVSLTLSLASWHATASESGELSTPVTTSPQPKAVASRVAPPKPRAMVMPGLGEMPGAPDGRENNVVRSTSTATEVVEISSQYMNRISTPFKAPRMIHAESEDVMKVVSDGQQLYVTLGDVTKTIAAHITGSDPNDPVFSLSLVPKNIEAQVLVLQLDGAGGSMAGGATGAPDKRAKSPVYVEKITSVLRAVALGATPTGFSAGRLPLAAVSYGSFTAAPLMRYSGPEFDVYRYRLTTQGTETIEMQEESFYSKGVRAVAFFPTALLDANSPTDVFVVADKSATARGAR